MENTKQILARLPHAPGVYLYSNSLGDVIYVGKARDLYHRVHQYFSGRDAVGEKTTQLVSEIEHIRIIQTTSEFDALLLEAKLIRQYMPKYNAILRDDRSPLYICLTFSEKLPRILFLRKSSLGPYEKLKSNVIYGPLASPRAARVIMRQLRSIVPYCTQKTRNGKPCFYTHIGLCDPCPSGIEKLQGLTKNIQTKKYRENIRKLQKILEGKSNYVLSLYEKQMIQESEALHFEKAGEIKNRIRALSNIAQLRYDPSVFLEIGADAVFENEIEDLKNLLHTHFPTLQSLCRIECYDISHLSGTATVGSMVVLINGKPQPSEYRRFRIQTVRGISDVASLSEVLTRRLTHTEWQAADFILIDGGKPQVAAIQKVFQQKNISIPFAGLAKRFEEIVIPQEKGFTVLRLPLTGKAIKVLERIRDEAHRFAITYSRSIRSKKYN
jgi:excinuclease ABC subunit C